MTARTVALGALLVSVALVAFAGAAHAELDARAKAVSHHRQGQAYFKAREFDRALGEFQAALDLQAEASLEPDQVALLTFNVALCHDAANRPEQALVAFRRYLEMMPAGELADEARDDVARLAPIVDKIVADRAEAAHRHEQAVRTERTPRPEPHASAAARYTVYAGAAIAAAGAVTHVLAWRTRQQLESAPDPDAYFAHRDTFRIERSLAIGGYAAGAVVVAAGLILGRTVLREEPQVSAALLPGGALLAIGWSR
jgi:tetratricopeptide (TPR) repeat protein